MAKSKKINVVIKTLERAIFECERYNRENIERVKSADGETKTEYLRAIDFYDCRISGLKRAMDFIKEEYK